MGGFKSQDQQAGGQVSRLAKIKFNRVPGCEEVCEWEVKWEMGDLTLTPKLV